MPKEVIHGLSVPHIQEGSEEEWEHPVAVVTWNRVGDVQLVTREHGAEIPSPEEQEQNGGWPIRYGYYVSLDRGAINELIRKLRRARDQAFGKDE